MDMLLNTKPKIIAIPFAGGNKYSFNKIENHISQDFEWITLELPGRGGRFNESLFDNISEMVDDLYNNIQSHITQGDYVLYGHSMGAILGYELIKKLSENGWKLPITLFFTGKGAPEYNHLMDKKSMLPQDSFWKEIIKIGGMPKNVLDQKELLEVCYPIIKNDFKALENYVYTKMKIPFSIPIQILIGEEEDILIDNVTAWANETNSICEVKIIPGDHFFVLEKAEMIAQRIMNVFEVCFNATE